ncbi:MAG: ABC transporter permease, partial [Myxococcota bacterium]|nr:ABC transporter permease [Myxococcota bacterium]
MRTLLRWPLLRKELRALAPLALLCFLLISGDLLTRPFTEQLDAASWASISSIEPGEGGGVLAFMLGLLAFFVAYAAFPREHDEGTIDLLWSLPVTRRRVFATKVIAGIGVLVTFVGIGQLTNWMLQLPNPQSFTGEQFRFDVALRVFALQSIFVAVAYCHGLLASSLRMFGLLPYLLLMWVILVAEEIEPSLAVLSPATICRFTYEGQRLLLPWDAIVIQGGAALGALALAYAAWMGPFEQVRDAFAPKPEGRSVVATIGFGCGTAAIVVVALGLVIFLSLRAVEEHGPSDAEEDPGIAWQTADARSEHYAFTYPTSLRARALRLIGGADAIAESVARTLGAREVPFVTVDLAETSGHHEGIAAGTRIRMGLIGQDDELRLRHVLAHESTHVFQGRESDRRLMTQRGTRAFVEGSAEWVGYEVVPNDAARRESRIVAAASFERHHIELEDVLDDDRLRARYDTALSYSLGEAWTEAIAEACGRAAVGDVMRAIGRDDAARDLAPLALWQDALQSIGCSEVAARGRWESLLARTADQEREAIEAIPRAGAGVIAREEG